VEGLVVVEAAKEEEVVVVDAPVRPAIGTRNDNNVPQRPTPQPTPDPTPDPTLEPSSVPTKDSSSVPSSAPSSGPSAGPTREPVPGVIIDISPGPTREPTPNPTQGPSRGPTLEPTPNPTVAASPGPTLEPTPNPTQAPSPGPTRGPSKEPDRVKVYTYVSNKTLNHIAETENSNIINIDTNTNTNTNTLDNSWHIHQWREAWERHGYDPVVLTLEDAVSHPDFAGTEERVRRLAQDRHNRDSMDCYFRYLAVSARGGGILVDLDTVPKNMAREEDRKAPDSLTLYCNSNVGSSSPVEITTEDNNGNNNNNNNNNNENNKKSGDWLHGVESQACLPCIASGTADEWRRVLGRVLDVSQEFQETRGWTDRHSLHHLPSMPDTNVKFVKEERALSWRTRSWDVCSLRYF